MVYSMLFIDTKLCVLLHVQYKSHYMYNIFASTVQKIAIWKKSKIFYYMTGNFFCMKLFTFLFNENSSKRFLTKSYEKETLIQHKQHL